MDRYIPATQRQPIEEIRAMLRTMDNSQLESQLNGSSNINIQNLIRAELKRRSRALRNEANSR